METKLLQGKVKTNSSVIGIMYNNEFIKLSLKVLASQVIDEDIVLFEKTNQTQAIVTEIIERKRQPFIGIISKITPKFIYIHLPLHNPFSSIPYPNSDIQQVKIGKKIVGWIGLNEFKILDFYDEKNIKELVQRYYSEFFNLNLDINLIPDKTSLESPKKGTTKKGTPTKATTKKGTPTKDLTHLQTFHIDPSGCIDIDDLMSCDKKNNKIYIHIVDVTKYILLNSEEDLNQRKLGYTWYFPSFAFHLFPNVEKIFENKEIHCLTLEINVSPENSTEQKINGNIEIYKSKIKCQYDLTYSQAQEIFDLKVSHPLQEDLLWSLEVLETYQMPKSSPYRRLFWNESKDNKISVSYEEECLAHRYISGWMIFYNSWFAENFKTPQRFHPETKLFQIPYQEDLPKEIQYIIYVKQMRQAEYRNENEHGHFGLDKKFYTHATSPLRRYFDRLNQYIYSGEIENCSDIFLEHLNYMERISERVREWYDKQLMFRYVEQESNRLWKSYIVKVHFSGVELYIYDLQEFLFISNLKDKKVGDILHLKLYIDRKPIPTLKYEL
jgi:exoribonuclease R